ncbi:unnamed protein product, partial [Ectocarpus fasciculatus]
RRRHRHRWRGVVRRGGPALRSVLRATTRRARRRRIGRVGRKRRTSAGVWSDRATCFDGLSFCPAAAAAAAAPRPRRRSRSTARSLAATAAAAGSGRVYLVEVPCWQCSECHPLPAATPYSSSFP